MLIQILRRLDIPCVVLAVATLIGITSSIVISEVFTKLPDSPSYFSIILLIGALFCTVALPFVISFYAIWKCVGRGYSKRVRLTRVSLAYLANILTFTGLYYSAAFFGDHQDAVIKYNYYRNWEQINRLNSDLYAAKEGPPIRSYRAFARGQAGHIDDLQPLAG